MYLSGFLFSHYNCEFGIAPLEVPVAFGSGGVPSTLMSPWYLCPCLSASQFLFNSELGSARPGKRLSSSHGPARGALGPITSTLSRNVLSKLALVCSGYVRGHIDDLMAAVAPAEPRGSCAEHCNPFYGLSKGRARGLPSAALPAHKEEKSPRVKIHFQNCHRVQINCGGT